MQESWLDICYCIAEQTYALVHDLFQHSAVNKHRLRPEDFLNARQKDKAFSPAATTTNSIQFRDQALHSELVKNNGTIGAEKNVQSFFLDPKFSKVMTVLPESTLTLPHAIIYEPHALVNSNQKHSMQVYVRTDRTPLLSLTVAG